MRKRMARKYRCCICGGMFEGYGNDPWPVVSSGECCDRCNCTVVLKARYDYGNKNSNKS